ncbi:MAG: hypothetical protein ABIP38_14540 [Steroidobacteraceae bacterium]
MLQQPRAPRAAARAALVPVLLSLCGTAAAADNCDRACLTGLLTQYVDAIVAHDTSKLPLAESVRITEDSKAIKLGEGISKTVTGKGTFRHDYLDTKKQVAATHVLLQEGKTQVLLSLLLHVKDRKIAGIETLVQRVPTEGRMQPTELGKPVRGMNDPVPAGKKQSRESMIRTALTYTEGLRIGSFIDGGTPFAPETYRVENGVILAGAGCGRDDCSLYGQNLLLHPSIVASVAAVDEDNGVVLLWMNFGHTGPSYGEGNSLVTFEAFKVWGGQIHTINAFFKGMPIATSRFWPTSDPVSK